MTEEEKLASVTVYLAKVVDHLQGVDDEHTIDPIRRRQSLHGARSRRLSEDLQVQDLLSGVQEANSSLEVRPQCEDQTIGSDGLAESEG